MMEFKKHLQTFGFPFSEVFILFLSFKEFDQAISLWQPHSLKKLFIYMFSN